VEHRLAELARQSGQVYEVIRAQKLITAARRNRDAALIATKALGLEFPTRGGFQLECRHPEIITLGLSILEGCGLIFVNYSHRHGHFLRRAIRWTLDPARTIVHVYELEIKEIGDAGAKT
jgi:hypothetical protein